MADKKKNYRNTGGARNAPKLPDIPEAARKTGGGRNLGTEKITDPIKKKIKKVTAPIKKKIKEFANRKTKEYRDDERKFQKKMYDPMSIEKKSALDYIKMHPVFSSRTSAATELNKLINTKKERKAAGLDYKKGGAVHRMPDGTMMKGAKHGMEAGGYVLNADEKRRRKEFKGASAVKSNVGKKMKKMKHGGIVDRQYLKGK